MVEVQVKNRESEDAFLTQWGKLDNREFAKDNIYFVDGGVLDNRPFSYTTEAMYYRTADRPVNRQLFYLDPNPESFVNSSKFTEMEQPTVWEVITGSLISLPRYESIGKD
ncbi:MAG: hypothetical protein RLZZ148_2870, partial [Cyanobacteriota bacterium]